MLKHTTVSMAKTQILMRPNTSEAGSHLLSVEDKTTHIGRQFTNFKQKHTLTAGSSDCEPL